MYKTTSGLFPRSFDLKNYGTHWLYKNKTLVWINYQTDPYIKIQPLLLKKP